MSRYILHRNLLRRLCKNNILFCSDAKGNVCYKLSNAELEFIHPRTVEHREEIKEMYKIKKSRSAKRIEQKLMFSMFIFVFLAL